VTLESGDLSASLRGADLIVSGAGSPHLVKPDMLKEGVVLIDAGTSESGGAIVGDADPACADKCSLFTPVPGGVGPLAVACLFDNVVTLAERTTKS
jgi:methylenetetrahydrofolate dehydrogenase (NADP+)/methenyltetrahydrofolate cyclohydrolase